MFALGGPHHKNQNGQANAAFQNKAEKSFL